jgi:uncharacterized protein YqiB (DUF1249 family)
MKTLNNNPLAGYGCEDVELRGFVSLMDLYENNFLRLRRLIPDLFKMPAGSVSTLPGCLPLYMCISEQTKFTTTLSLTYYFEEDEKVVAEPALTIRVYHDAHQVEVLTGHLRHGRERYDHIPEMAKVVKWKLNRFLYKWLGYCLHLGHQFTVENVSHKELDQQADLSTGLLSKKSVDQTSHVASLQVRIKPKES